MGWALALLMAASASGALGLATVRRWTREPAALPARRDPRTLPDVDLRLILSKIREGDLLAIRGDLAGARRAWTEARRRGEGIWQIHEGIGDSLARVALRDEAEREYATAESLVPSRFVEARRTIRAKRAQSAWDAGRHRDAFVLMLDLDPPPSDRLVALWSLVPDKPNLLRRTRERAEVANPKLWFAISEFHRLEGAATESARALARYARSVEPWNASLCRLAVSRLREVKLHTEALEVCGAWSRALPQDVDAHRSAGDLWRELGDLRRAYLAYTSIVDIRPGDADAHRLLGRALREMRRLDEAIRSFENSKSLRPEEPDRWIDVAETVALRDPAAAEKLFDEIARKTWDARFGNVVETIRRRQAERWVREFEEAKKRGDQARVRELRRILGQYNVPEGAFDLKIVMTWDTQTDVDMDVIDPSGEHVHHGHAGSKAGGKYWVDNTSGHGPETFTLPRAAAGTYRIGAHFHSGAVRTTVKFVLILYEDTDRERRIERELIFEKAGEQKFLPELTIP